MSQFVNIDIHVPASMARRIIFHAYALEMKGMDGLASIFARSAGYAYHFAPRGKFPGRIGFAEPDTGRTWSLDYPCFDSVKFNYTHDVTLIVPPILREVVGAKRLKPGKSHGFTYNLDIDADWYSIAQRNRPGMSDSQIMDTAFKYYEAFWWHTRCGRVFVDKSPLSHTKEIDETLLANLVYGEK